MGERVKHPTALGRRAFLAFTLAALSGNPAAASGAEPLAVIKKIYQRAVKGDGPSWIENKERAQDLSKSLAALWAKADAKTAPGDEGPIDFDLVADTNGLTLAGFSLKSEKQDDKSATIAAALTYKESNPRPGQTIVRYDLVRQDDQWKIDEIRSSNWSLRDMLTHALTP